MKRSVFLTHHWRGTPVPGLDFSDHCQRQAFGYQWNVGRFCGWQKNRSTEVAEKILLSWNGQSSSLTIASVDVSLGQLDELDGGFTVTTLAREVLQAGDIVLLRSSDGQVDAIQLLVPSEESTNLPSLAMNYQLSRDWTQYLQALRSFFNDLDFIEASTPGLVISPGMEPHLHSFSTESLWMKKKQEFFLPTSPEFHLKKLLCREWSKVFEIKRCYRNEEKGKLHQPEFLMLEWYRAFAPLSRITEDLQSLLRALAAGSGRDEASVEIEQTSMRELLGEHAELELSPQTTIEELRQCCRNWNLHWTQEDSWDDLFQRIFLEKIEPILQQRGLVLVSDFPPQQMDLARRQSEGWSDRFELYWQGVEIANAFQELNDWREQELRIQQSNQIKKQLGLKPFPVDQDFINHLRRGLPPSSGIAVGVERLFMMLQRKNSLQEVVFFPHLSLNDQFL